MWLWGFVVEMKSRVDNLGLNEGSWAYLHSGYVRKRQNKFAKIGDNIQESN